jgi:regulator of replication initiation timing
LLSQKLSLQTKKVSLEKQNTDLKNQLKSMQTDNAATAVENAEIRNQIEWVKETGAPKITTRLGTADVRSSPATGHPWSGVVRFYISGEVWNMGTGPAENCRLRVTLFQGDAVANDTYVEIGTIDAGNYVYVEANIFYTGEALTNWVITSEYS